MQISIDNKIRPYEGVARRSGKKVNDGASFAAGRNQDQVIIGSSAMQIEEKKMAEKMAYTVVRDVQIPTSQEKIDSLKQQVAEGTYKPDAEKIVSRMLLEKGTGSNE